MSNPRSNSRLNQEKPITDLHPHFDAYREEPSPYTIHVKEAGQIGARRLQRRKALDQQSYLQSLEQEIQSLRSQIQQQPARYRSNSKKSRYQFLDPNISRPNSIHSRRSNAGKLYSKAEPSFSQHKAKNSQKSSFYKWSPQINPQSIQDNVDNNSLVNPRKSSYRVKAFRGKEQKKIKTQSVPFLKQNKQLGQQQLAQQLKEVFVFKPQWEINSILDDFRTKINSKLQIPKGFPLPPPSIRDAFQDHVQKAQQIYKLFNLRVQKFKQQLIVRRFKNGVYYQMKPNKNIVWYFNGSFYFGEWDTDLPSEAEKNGFGFQYIPNKHFYLGSFKNGMRNGQGVIKLINRHPELFIGFDCEWLDGKPNGRGKQIDQRNNKYIGDFVNGQKTGKAIVLNSDGLYYQGELVNGIKEGEGMEKLINGDIYTGGFHQQQFHGLGTYKWKNGSVYQGQFVNGKRQGKGLWKSFNGDQFQGIYLNDIKQGWGKFTWKNGQIYEGEFKNDMRDGIGYYKHPNGKIGKYMWKEGHIETRLVEQQQGKQLLDNKIAMKPIQA